MTRKNVGKHFHVVIWAAEDRTESGYSGVTYIDLIAQSREEAVKRAKELAPEARHYHVNNIIEHHGHEG